MIRSKLRSSAEQLAEDRDLPASGSPAPRRKFMVRILPSLLCLLYGAQCAWFIATQSMTADEPEHIAAGLDAWRHGEFRSWDDQPPLARLLFALPLLDTSWRFEAVAGEIEPIRPGPQSWAWRARPVNVLLGFLLAALLWTTARRRFSAGAANLALALFVFSPALIAHFSVAAIDGVATLLIFATALQVARWCRQPSFAETLLLGLVLGGLLLAKFHTLPLFALALGVVLLHKPLFHGLGRLLLPCFQGDVSAGAGDGDVFRLQHPAGAPPASELPCESLYPRLRIPDRFRQCRAP